jgi:hypothetical protein
MVNEKHVNPAREREEVVDETKPCFYFWGGK